MKLSSSLTILALALTTPGCGWFGIGKAPSSGASASPAPEGGGDGEASATDETSTEEEAVAADTGPSAADLEEAMAPPEGAIDLRAIFGTDPEDPMPAVFAGVTPTSTPDELSELFPGIGTDMRIYERAKFTRKVPDGKWSAVRHGAPHRDLFSITHDGDRVHSLSYTTDPGAWMDGTWDYAKKAAMARWGVPTQGEKTVGYILTFELEEITVSLHGGSPGKKELFLTTTFKD